MGYWAQGDCVWFPEAMDAQDAIGEYRRGLAAYEIAVQTTRPDGVIAKERQRTIDAQAAAMADLRARVAALEAALGDAMVTVGGAIVLMRETQPAYGELVVALEDMRAALPPPPAAGEGGDAP